MPPSVPDVIGRYQILRTIGEGGMGKLYLARDPDIERNVAIKVLREGLDDPELRERFAREARSAGRLQHINIVTIFDVGKHQGQPFIAMEFVKGETLANLLKIRHPMSLARKFQIMEDLCSGLHYAHRAGVVHRDIKPGNIVIGDDGILKILDFGIARLGGSGMTQAGMVMGTLNYMPPEQMEGRPVDARADMFSAGALFYELLSYQLAFPGDLRTGIVVKILSGQPEPLDRLVPNIDPGLVALVSRCLEKQPEKRFPDMAAVKREFANLRRRLSLEDEEPPEDLPTMIAGPLTADSPKTIPAAPPKASQVESVRDKRMKIRAEQLQTHISKARRAIEIGDYRAVLEACHEALVLDPENVEANDLEGRARAALDEQQLEQWLTEAREKLDRGDLTIASGLVDQALGLNKHSPDAIALRKSIAEVRRQKAAEQARAREFEEALAQAKRDLAAGSLDTATSAINRALELQPADSAARTIKDRITGAITAKKRAEEIAQARQVVADARQQFAAGDHAKAIEKLESIESGSTIVGGVLAELRREAEEIERRRLAAEAARKRQQEEEDRRQAEEARRLAEEAEARRLAAEAARKKEEEERRLAAEAAWQRELEEQERRRKEEEARRQAQEAEAQRLAAEAARKKEEEERRLAAEAARQRELEEQERRHKEEEARRQAQEAEARRQAQEAEARRQAQEAEARRLAAEAARKKEEEERRLAAEAARQRELEAQERRRKEEEARRQAAEAEARRLAAEAARKKEKEEHEAAERTRREVGKLLGKATKAVARREWPSALEQVEQALGLDASHEAATALKRQIEAAIAREQETAESADQPTVWVPAPARQDSAAEPTAHGDSTAPEDIDATIQAPVPGAVRESIPPVAARSDASAAPAAPVMPVMNDATLETLRFPAVSPVQAPASVRIESRAGTIPAPAIQLPAKNKRLMMIAAAVLVGALVAGTLVIPMLRTEEAAPSAPAATGPPGTIVLNITPWATIDAITRKSDGQRVGGANLVTPVVVALPPGDYHVKATNPYSQPLEFDVSVAAGAVQEVRRVMPDLKPEEEVTNFLTQ